jgi:peptidoglycan/LPS O-acetylase OafA/YrhL
MADDRRQVYRPDIDGLRALAVTSVLLFHCGVPGFPGGYVGVDVFFVISGFLIAGQLAHDVAVERLSILGFYDRRIRRVLPALFVTLILTAVAATALLLPSYLQATSRALVAAAASVSNIYFWQTANYFEPDSAFQPLLHTWSLSVEEQFYLFIPVLMLCGARLLRQRWIFFFGPICLLSFALSVAATNTAPTANFYLLPTRAWEFAVGCLTATTRLPTVRRRLITEAGSAVALAMLLAPVFLFDDTTPFPGLNAAWPCLGTALLIHLGRVPGATVTRLLSTQPFVAVGLISYSLYLVHWPIISLMRYTGVAPLDERGIVIAITGSVVLATLSWRFVEQPFRRPNSLLTRRRVLTGGVASILAVSAIGWVGIIGQGFPSRFPGFAETIIPGHEQWKPGRCFLTGDPDYRRWSLTDCTRIATGPEKVLLWGDSFASQYVPGILANAAALHATVIQYTAAGCPPVLSYRSYARLGCTEFNRNALAVIRAQQVRTVILSGRWTDMLERGLAEIGSTLSALDELGVRVVLIGQSPEFAADVRVIGFLKGSKLPGAINRWNVTFPGAINDTLRDVTGQHAFIDPMPALCDGLICTYQENGVFLFEDYGHYSAVGSKLVVRRLFVDSALADMGPQSRFAR